MSPRGKTIPGVEEQLFAATERLLGDAVPPVGLTSRAITDTAGCAKGVLHNHFGDLAGFLAAFVVDRTMRLAEEASKLPALAGTGSVAENLTDASLRLFGSTAIAISGLVISRPEVAKRLREEEGATPALDEIQSAIADYLAAEVRLGRIVPDTDIRTLAFTVFASTHHLFFNNAGQPISQDRLLEVMASLLAGKLAAD